MNSFGEEYLDTRRERNRLVHPMLYRDKDKFWFMGSRFSDYHRMDGPAIMRYALDRVWCYNDEDWTDEVNRWCENNEVDVEDMSEEEILIMWNEII